MTRFKIGQKLLLLLLAVSLGPLLIVGTLLVVNAQNDLRGQAVTQQKIIASNAADKVDSFLGDKTNILIFQSQTSAARQFDTANVGLDLAAMIKQDKDIERTALVDKAGMERVVLDRNGLITKHANLAQSDAFKSVTFLAGKEYIGPVVYANGQPHITIAVPLIRFTGQQDLTHLSTAEFGKYRTSDDIQGALIADFNLSDLWQSVLSTHIGNGGYAYVVDDKGSLIAHPNAAFLAKNHDVSQVQEVQDFLSNNSGIHTSQSETGVTVLANYHAITRTNWGVIVEEPASSVFSTVYAFYRLGGAILLAVAAVAVTCSLLFRQQLLVPIQMIAAGALRIGRGDLQYKIPVKTDDELGDLAHSFNTMGGNLQSLVLGLQQRNKSLSAEQHKLASVLESVSDGVIAVDKNQMITLINAPAARLVDKTPPELSGSNISSQFKLTSNDQPFTLDLAKTGVFYYDQLVLTRDDKVSYLELVVVVIDDPTADIAAIITVHDLTQSKELEVMKLDFVAIAAHELRTPLAVVRGYLNLVTTSPEISKLTISNIEYLQRAESGVSQLGSLINNILNVSRIERGGMNIALAKTDIAQLLNRTVVQQQALETQRTLLYDGPASSVFVVADESAIGEVVNNLLINAIKYTPADGHITVKLNQHDGNARVEVIDDGRGIPESSFSRLFTKFYRVENSLTTGSRGTGLGLYISKSIIELHHGKIGMASKLGEGSTFYFTLPLYKEGDAADKTTQTKELRGVHGWFPKRPNR